MILSKETQETARSVSSTIISVRARVHKQRCQGRYKHIALHIVFSISPMTTILTEIAGWFISCQKYLYS